MHTVLFTVTLESSSPDLDFFDDNEAPAVSSQGEHLTCFVPMAPVKQLIESTASAFFTTDNIAAIVLSPLARNALFADVVFFDESDPFPLSLLGDFELTEVKINAPYPSDNGKVYKLFGTWCSRDGRAIRAEARCELNT